MRTPRYFSIAIFTILVIFSKTSFSQKINESLLIKNWEKVDIKRPDGSKIFDESLINVNFDLNFMSKDSVRVNFGGRAQDFHFMVKDSVLSFNDMKFKIEVLEDISLVLLLQNEYEPSQSYKFIYIPKKLNDLTFTPRSYVSKSGEIVYDYVPNRLEPYFMSKKLLAMEYIFENFQFPDFRKGGFVVRFVVTEKGDVKGVRIVASSNDKFNNKLIMAVKKTQGKWKPAEYLGERVSVNMEYDFNLDFTNAEVSSGDSLEFSKMNYEYATEFFQRGAYMQAEKYYSKALKYNVLNIDAYYQRAATYILLRKKDEACQDYQQLIFLDQKKAKILHDKYCN